MRVLVLGLLAAMGALAQKVDVQFDPSINFARYRTFAIRGARLNSKDSRLNGELVRKRLDYDIQKFFEARKLVFVASGRADLEVRYTLGAVQATQREIYPAGWWGARVVRVPYTEGTLVIDLRESSTHGLVWRAITHDENRDAAKLEGKLDDMVRKSAEKYPPKTK